MKHLQSKRRARLYRMVLLLGLGLQLSVLACSVPVFRYALERWPPDTYRYVVFHDGPLTPDQQTLVDQLEQIKMLGYGRPSLLGYTVDVSQEIEETFAPLWEEHKDESLPLLILLPPIPVAGSQALWTAPFTEETVKTLIESPVRTELVKRLTDGQTAVWLLLLSGDADTDKQVKADLQRMLDEIHEVLKLPHEMDPTDASYDMSMSDVDLRVEFTVLPIDLNDPKEAILAAIIRAALLDDLDESLPGAIPVFGRGRALVALDKESIVEDVIAEIGYFLVGPCSCQVKQMNPGVDFLIPVDWDGLITGLMGAEDILPALIVPVALAAPELNEPNEANEPIAPAEQDSTVEVNEPNETLSAPHESAPTVGSGGLSRNLIVLAIVGLLGLVLATVFMTRKTKRRTDP
jgi:hypothetical protein